MAAKVRVGIVGCGTISGIYLKVASTFELLEIVACADIVVERARARAAEFGVPKAVSVEELLADPEVEPVAAAAFFANHGHESWHPDPGFYYQPGGGPMLDMGPYYLTALVNLIGPIRRVTGSARATFPEREIGSGPKRGQTIPVDTPTHVAGVVDFASGAIGTILTSFDVWAHSLPRIEIYGSAGTLGVPDPNTFGRSGRPHRASGELAYHVLDVMQSFAEASAAGRHVEVASSCERPAALPTGLA